MSVCMIFMVTPCINDIKHFIIQLIHTTWKRRVIKTYQNYESCPNVFRFTRKPSSGSHSHYLAKITDLLQCRYRRLTDVVSVMVAYRLYDVCIHIEPSL